MATAELSGIVEFSRAVVSAAAELMAGVERAMASDGKVRTARGNAWDALQADQARARARAELEQVVAALLADRPHHPIPRDPSRPTSRDLGVVVGAKQAISR